MILVVFVVIAMFFYKNAFVSLRRKYLYTVFPVHRLTLFSCTPFFLYTVEGYFLQIIFRISLNRILSRSMPPEFPAIPHNPTKAMSGTWPARSEKASIPQKAEINICEKRSHHPFTPRFRTRAIPPTRPKQAPIRHSFTTSNHLLISLIIASLTPESF